MILVSGDFTMQVQIACSQCRRTALSRHRVSVQQCDAAEMEDTLVTEFRRCVPNIPVGWSMNGRHDLRCEECI